MTRPFLIVSDAGGFAVEVRRTIHQDGAVRGTDTLHWTYRGLD